MTGSGSGEPTGPPGSDGREDDRHGREEVLESRRVFDGRLLRVDVERVRLPDGSTAEREVVRHPGAAAVLPVFTGGSEEGSPGPSVLLVRQYRHAAGRSMWEIPAGTLEPGEDPRACAARELEEEAGLVAGELTLLGAVHTSPGFTDERVHLFAALDPRRGEPRPEPEETIRSEEMPLAAALAMVDDGRLEDAKSVAALLLADRATISSRGLS